MVVDPETVLVPLLTVAETRACPEDAYVDVVADVFPNLVSMAIERELGKSGDEL